MPGVVLGIEIIDDSLIKSLRGQLASIKKQTLHDTATFFHEQIVPRRFTPRNESRYRHEKRNQVYKDHIKKRFGTGQGKYVNLTLSGKTKRRALLGKVTAAQHRATLTVDTPTYFRRPFVGTFRDEKGRQKRVTHQPDKVAETVQISEAEKKELRQYAATTMLHHIKNPPERKPRRQTITG